jgi:hypothetical protein
MTSPDERGSQTTFRAVRGGVTSKSAFPESFDCKDPETHETIATLRDVSGEIFIVGHGNGQQPRLDIGFGPRGTIDRVTYGPEELADLLVRDGLACDQKKVTLLIVQGGSALQDAGVNRRFIELYRKVALLLSSLSLFFFFDVVFSKMRSPAAQTVHEQDQLRGQWVALAMRSRDPDL